jgi:hypothetical protein
VPLAATFRLVVGLSVPPATVSVPPPATSSSPAAPVPELSVTVCPLPTTMSSVAAGVVVNAVVL